VPEAPSATVRRRQLGALLRARRLELGFTVEQVAERLLCSSSKVSRMETGDRGATARDIRDLCDIYEIADDAERARLATLAKEGKQSDWWQPYDLPFDTYVGLEAGAVSTKYYQSTVIPGLLQTPDYARAMHEVVVPKLGPERIDELVKVRLKRQELLERDPPLTISTILDEAALHRVVGSAPIMRAQLDRLIEMGRLGKVTIQVIPYAAGAHQAMDSTFRILEFGSSQVPDVVYVEGLVGYLYLDRPADVRRYEEAFESLSKVALTPKESVDLIAQIGVTYQNAPV
jgi:transcriptional regulator with XRE-family HTH domain